MPVGVARACAHAAFARLHQQQQFDGLPRRCGLLGQRPLVGEACVLRSPAGEVREVFDRWAVSQVDTKSGGAIGVGPRLQRRIRAQQPLARQQVGEVRPTLLGVGCRCQCERRGEQGGDQKTVATTHRGVGLLARHQRPRAIAFVLNGVRSTATPLRPHFGVSRSPWAR